MQVLRLAQAVALASAVLMAGCGADGSDGATGLTGETGSQGNAGYNSLISQIPLVAGDDQCFQGGTRLDSGLDSDEDGVLDADEITDTSYSCYSTELNEDYNFIRIASFPVCSQLDVNCDTDTETAAEIVDYSEDGMTLIYTNSPAENIGFVDITDPENPVAAGELDMGGEPTSVAVVGSYALIGVNTSTDYVNVSGVLSVVNIASQSVVSTIDLGGQPDSVAVSPDGMYAAIAIENERDEDLNDGQIDSDPQLPAGYLVIVDLSDADPANWTRTDVEMTGLADIAPTDPEPEYVDINDDNVAVVTLQENNHIVLVDLETAAVTNHFSAGFVDLDMIDATEEDPAQIIQTESLADIPREPDGVTWINSDYLVTADEGDMNGGSRGFTVFNSKGEVIYTSGNSLDQLAARVGHYPDARSENKGNEPENAEVGIYGNSRYLFVNSERSSLVFVYDVADPARPMLKQILPAGSGPEGVKAIPSRNLLVAASENDSRGDKMRSVVNIYQYVNDDAAYPSLMSSDRSDGTPIPFAALSGLAVDVNDPYMLWTLEDSFFGANRIMKIDTSSYPGEIVEEIRIKDSNDVLRSAMEALSSGAAEDADSLDDTDIDAMINGDKTVNIDGEGIATFDGGFLVASEGAGTKSDTANRPINSLNMVLELDSEGIVVDVYTLPTSWNDEQVRFGFEGVTIDFESGNMIVPIQRAWSGTGASDPALAVYNPDLETWSFISYELDSVESQNNGWVGLSDIAWSGVENVFFVLERDNQGGPDAAIKRVYQVDITGLNDGGSIALADKILVLDIFDVVDSSGLMPEKFEGLSYNTSWNEFFLLNDNDGVDDNSGEIHLILVEDAWNP